MQFLTPTHIHIVFTLFNQKSPLKTDIQGNNLHIFLWHLKIWILRKKLFRNLKISKLGMPKKMTPKSQAKNKTPFPQSHFKLFITLKKHHANKYTILSFNRIMRIYSNVYNYTIYPKLSWTTHFCFQIQNFEELLCSEMYFLREQFI